MVASTFRYDSGVEALRIANKMGSLVLLPFQGQQIWSAEFGGRNLTMKSMFDEPRATTQYLENYGGFLLHCGATAMGVPGQRRQSSSARRTAQRPLSACVPAGGGG
jgi:hypothetical protein